MKSANTALAEYFSNRTDIFQGLLREALSTEYIRNPNDFLATWYASQLNYFAGHPPHTAEWIETLADGVRRAGAGLADLLEQARSLRLVLLDYATHDKNGPDVDMLTDSIRMLAEHHEQVAIENWSQLQREQLRAEQRRQRTIAEAIAGPVAVIDREGIIQWTNRRFAALYAQKPDSMTGRALSAWCAGNAENELRRFLRQQTSRGQKEFAGHILLAQGKQVSARFLAEPFYNAQGLRDGAMVLLESPELFPQNEQDLIMPALRAMFSAIPACFQVQDKNFDPVFTLGNLTQVLGSNCNHDTSVCCQIMAAELKKGAICPCHNVLTTGEPFLGDATVSIDGQTRCFLLFIAPVRAITGESNRLAILLYNDSRRRQLDRHLESLLLEYRETPLASQLAITVAHELRNPLSVLLGFAEILDRGVEATHLPGVTEKVLRNALRCKEIVDNLLEFGRGGPSDRIPFDLCTVIREQVQSAFSARELAKIQWYLPAQPCLAEGVPGQFAQVCLNLLRNALRAAKAQVAFCLTCVPDKIRLEISDDGAGVPSELQENIFVPFFSTYKAHGALGLGLSLSQAVIKEYGGRLWLDNSGESAACDCRLPGACFIVELPSIFTETEQEENAMQAVIPSDDAKRVLVVDDEADLVEMLTMILTLNGYLVDSASTAEQALEMMRHGSYDAVTLDIQLPGEMGGEACYQAILELNAELGRKTVFVTADTMSFHTRQFLDRIQRPFLEKPFLMQDLLDMIGSLVKQS